MQRTSEEVQLQTHFRLTTPFNTLSDVFAESKHIPELNADLLAPQHSKEIFGVGTTRQEKVDAETQVVLFRDGRQWHFDAAGNLVAIEDAPLAVVYRRDGTGRIRRIEGWYGDNLRADIQLTYDLQGRLLNAKGSNKAETNYRYDAKGHLQEVSGFPGNLGYAYQDGLVTKVTLDGEPLSEFSYNDRGQLLSQRRADGKTFSYDIKPTQEGIHIAAISKDAKIQNSIDYDPAFRPLRQTFADGTEMKSHYEPNGEIYSILSSPTGEYRIGRSKDGSEQTLTLPEGGIYSERFDQAGRRVASLKESQTVSESRWYPNGLLAELKTTGSALIPQYRDDGVADSLLIAAPSQDKKLKEWLQIKLDELGRPNEIGDFTGGKIALGYDDRGELAELESERGRLSLERDQKGRLKTLLTNWGVESSATYDSKSGKLEKIEITSGDDQSEMAFVDGRLSKVKQFDGGMIELSYAGKSQAGGRLSEIHLPNGLKMQYQYNDQGLLSNVTIGDKIAYRYQYNKEGKLTGLQQVALQ
jgi:YD repeat-containing protein